jgi:hypothetical protein
MKKEIYNLRKDFADLLCENNSIAHLYNVKCTEFNEAVERNNQ